MGTISVYIPPPPLIIPPTMTVSHFELPYCSLGKEYCYDSILPSNYNPAARFAWCHPSPFSLPTFLHLLRMYLLISYRIRRYKHISGPFRLCPSISAFHHPPIAATPMFTSNRCQSSLWYPRFSLLASVNANRIRAEDSTYEMRIEVGSADALWLSLIQMSSSSVRTGRILMCRGDQGSRYPCLHGIDMSM